MRTILSCFAMALLLCSCRTGPTDKGRMSLHVNQVLIIPDLDQKIKFSELNKPERITRTFELFAVTADEIIVLPNGGLKAEGKARTHTTEDETIEADTIVIQPTDNGRIALVASGNVVLTQEDTKNRIMAANIERYYDKNKKSKTRSSSKTIIVKASIFPESKERQGSFKRRGPNGTLMDAPAPRRPTGRFLLSFTYDKKTLVRLPSPVLPHPKLLHNIKATVLVETKDGKNVFTILKIKSGNQTIYEREVTPSGLR